MGLINPYLERYYKTAVCLSRGLYFFRYEGIEFKTYPRLKYGTPQQAETESDCFKRLCLL